MSIVTWSFLNEGCVQRVWISGAIRFWRQWTEPLNQNEMMQSTTSSYSLVSRNRIWRRDFWRMTSSNSGPKSRHHRRHREPTHTSRNAILSDCLNSWLKTLTESEVPNMDSFPLHGLEVQVFSVSSEREKNPVQ